MKPSEFNEILNSSPIPMVLIGADQRIYSANERAFGLLGDGLLSRHYITALRQPALVEAVESVLSGKNDRAETRFGLTEALREVAYKVTVAKIDTTEGRMAMMSFVDTTDLQQAGQIRRDFVANVSHELKTPLTALLGFIETLRGAARDDPTARERFLEVMANEANRMNRLVSDLLSLSRVESEQRVRPQEPTDVAGLLRSAALSLRPLAEDAGIEINVGAFDNVVLVPGDADQLAQVFSNLIENAIKYSGRNAEVTVTLEPVERDLHIRGRSVLITVADSGEGFDPVHIPRLTERFYRVDSHRSRELGGTGLGLAIVKHIVTRHRGRLTIDSTPGEGSRFAVALPVD